MDVVTKIHEGPAPRTTLAYVAASIAMIFFAVASIVATYLNNGYWFQSNANEATTTRFVIKILFVAAGIIMLKGLDQPAWCAKWLALITISIFGVVLGQQHITGSTTNYVPATLLALLVALPALFISARHMWATARARQNA